MMIYSGRKKYHVRCRKCGGRRVLRMHPDHYRRRVRCHVCGTLHDWRIDYYRMNVEMHRLPCTCGGYWFPHRYGSLYCFFDKDGKPRNDIELETLHDERTIYFK